MSSRHPEGDRPLEVGELTALIRSQLENSWTHVWIEGEVSQPKLAGSGHVYFTLKDNMASLACVLWRSAVERTGGMPQHGDRIVARGGIKIYPPRGTYQLDIRSWQPSGLGNLEKRFRELRARLEAEGLFAPERKRPLPFLPRRIALVTSPSGAARHDMERSIRDRFPPADLVFLGAAVQGSRAVPQLVAAIRRAQEIPGVDVLVVGRGGGSLEDLWAFNEEAVLRAIVASRLPTVSAVGHEVDMCLSDLVADVRALTPTAVGGLVVPSWESLEELLRAHQLSLARALRSPLESARWQLRQIVDSRAWDRPTLLVQEGAHSCTQTGVALNGAMRGVLDAAAGDLRVLAGEIEALSPLKVLARGYAVALDTEGKLVRASTSQVGNDLQVKLQDGTVWATITEVLQT